MNRAVFGHALRQVRRAAVLVPIGCGLFFFLVLLSFSSFAKQAGVAAQFFQRPSRAMQAMLGGNTNLLKPTGWLASGLQHPIVLSLQTAGALMIAAGAVAAERERQSIELVLTHPVRRLQFLFAKVAAALVTVTLVQIGGAAGVLIARGSIGAVGEIPLGDVFRVFAGSWVLFASFAMVGVLISVRSSLRGRAVGASAGVVVGAFFVNFIGLLFDSVAWIRYASPFHYYRPADILTGSPYVADLLVLAAVAIGALGLASRWFVTRDVA